MGTLVMYDDTNPALIPASAAIIGYYKDGDFADGAAVAKRFPHAQLVGICVRGADDGDALDVENKDATIADVYSWLTRQIAKKVYRPLIYTSVGNVDSLMVTMTANKFERSAYRLWSAHYGAGQHICGPASCMATKTECDWTQWTDTYGGLSLDASLLSDEPFGPAAAAPATAKPAVNVRAQAQALLEDITGAAAKLAVLIPDMPE